VLQTEIPLHALSLPPTDPRLPAKDSPRMDTGGI
jgi:hypothetical protein